MLDQARFRNVKIKKVALVSVLLFAVVLLLRFLWDTQPVKLDSMIAFTEVTDKAGIQSYRGQSYGAAWGDVNNDGLPDLWASGHSPQRLLVNTGDGRFEDQTAALVSPIRYSDRHGAAWADMDNDGDEDLVQLSGAGRGDDEDANALFVNQGGYLKDAAEALGVDAGLMRARAPLWFDLDNDGRLDLMMTAAAREEAPPSLFRWRPSQGTFVQQPLEFLRASEIARLGRLGEAGGLQVLTGPPHELLVHELSNGMLVDVGARLGLDQLPGHSVSDVLIADLDNDLASDIVYVRGFIAPDVLQIGPRALECRLQAEPNRPARLRFTGPGQISVQPYPIGRHWWQRDNLFIGSAGQAPKATPIRLAKNDPEVQGLADQEAGLMLGYDNKAKAWMIELRAKSWNSVNLQISGDASIENLQVDGIELGVRPLQQFVQWNSGGGFEPPEPLAFGEPNCLAAGSGDFDNDMDIDLYLVCSGNLENSPNILLENLGGRRFQKVPGAGGAIASEEGLGESVAIADYDLDGYLDLFVRNGHELPPFADGPDQLFRNRGGQNHWLQIDLVGIESNRNGIGARVVVGAGGIHQVRVQDNGNHGRVQDFRRLHFGLGSNTRVDYVRVEWPSGKVTEFEGLGVDHVWRLSEDGQANRLVGPHN